MLQKDNEKSNENPQEIPLCESQVDQRVIDAKSYGILDTPKDENFDILTKICSILFGVPVSTISFIDSKRFFIKSHFGLKKDSQSVDRDSAICEHTLNQNNILVVNDTLKDDRFKNHPFVVNAPFIRFYAGVPLKSKNNNNIGVLCLKDFCPREIGEKELKILSTISEKVIMELENFKKKIQLKNDQEESEKLSKVKDEFLINMSHEIRTPLNSIYGFTELLLGTELNKKQKEYLSIIKCSVENLIVIINDMLDFSKIESGKISIENTDFDLYNTLKDIQNIFTIKAKEKQLNLTFNIDQKIPKIIKGDKIRLNQILINLIGNAIKFTEKGQIDVIVKIENLDIKNKTANIKFSVKDSGIGIEKSNFEKIFMRFEQANNSISRKYGGTGLGLSISKKLVELLGGTLNLDSQLGIGSEFSFSIKFDITSLKISNNIFVNKFFGKNIIKNKLTIDENNEKDNKIDKRIIDSNIKIKAAFQINNEYYDSDKIKNNKNLKVLLCEDTSFNIKLMQSLLEKFPVELDIAENGKLGVRKLVETRYDLILMDLQMPEMDGFQTSNYIRQTLGLKTPIFAMTANNSEFEKSKCLTEYRMNEYISKPFKPEKFFEMLNKYFPNFNLNSFENSITFNKINKDKIKIINNTEKNKKLIEIRENNIYNFKNNNKIFMNCQHNNLISNGNCNYNYDIIKTKIYENPLLDDKIESNERKNKKIKNVLISNKSNGLYDSNINDIRLEKFPKIYKDADLGSIDNIFLYKENSFSKLQDDKFTNGTNSKSSVYCNKKNNKNKIISENLRFYNRNKSISSLLKNFNCSRDNIYDCSKEINKNQSNSVTSLLKNQRSLLNYINNDNNNHNNLFRDNLLNSSLNEKIKIGVSPNLSINSDNEVNKIVPSNDNKSEFLNKSKFLNYMNFSRFNPSKEKLDKEKNYNNNLESVQYRLGLSSLKQTFEQSKLNASKKGAIGISFAIDSPKINLTKIRKENSKNLSFNSFFSNNRISTNIKNSYLAKKRDEYSNNFNSNFKDKIFKKINKTNLLLDEKSPLLEKKINEDFEEHLKKQILDKLNEFAGYEVDLIKEIIDSFLKEFPILIEELFLKVKNETNNEIGKIIHKIKSPLKIFGLENLLSLLNKINTIESKEKIGNTEKNGKRNIYKDSENEINSWIQEFKNEYIKIFKIIKELSEEIK